MQSEHPTSPQPEQDLRLPKDSKDSKDEDWPLWRLQAELSSTYPDLVIGHLDGLAEEFLRAAVRFARLMQYGVDNSWEGIHALTSGLLWLKESEGQLVKEIAIQNQIAPVGKRGGVT